MKKLTETTVTRTIELNQLPGTESHNIQMEIETPQPTTKIETTLSPTDTECQPNATTPQHIPPPLPETEIEQMETTASPLTIDQIIIPAPTITQPEQYVPQSATPALPRTEDLEPTHTQTISETQTATTPCIPETAPTSNITPLLETSTTTTSTEHEVLPCNSATPPRETTEDTISVERGSIPCSNTTQQIDSLTPTIEGYKGDTQDVMPPAPTMSEGQPDVQNGGPTNRITQSFQRDPSIDLPGNGWCLIWRSRPIVRRTGRCPPKQ